VLLVLSAFSACRAENFALYSLSQTAPNMLSIWSGNGSGILAYVGQVATGGDGSGVQSQNPLVVFKGYVFAVNAVSGTVSMFSVNSRDPTNVTLVGTPHSSGGDWPTSVTAAETIFGDLACVTNSGIQNGFSCLKFNSSGLFPIPGRNISSNFNLTLGTPPGNHLGPGQISFTPDGLSLVVVVKGFNPPLYFRNLESQELVHSTNKGSVNFAFAFNSDGTIAVVDVSPYNNASTGIIGVRIEDNPRDPRLTFDSTNYYLIPNQAGACWISYSTQTGYFYVSDIGSATVSEIEQHSINSFRVVHDYNLGSSSSPADSLILTMSGEDHLFVNDVGTVAIREFKLFPRVESVQNLTRADGGGQGLAGYVVPPTPTHHHHF